MKNLFKAFCFFSFIFMIGIGMALGMSFVKLSDYEFHRYVNEKYSTFGKILYLAPFAFYGLFVFIDLCPERNKRNMYL